VQLDLFGHAHPVIQQIRKAIGAASPRLDLEPQQLVLMYPELDLTRLQMAG
jgi:hypothetical protein